MRCVELEQVKGLFLNLASDYANESADDDKPDWLRETADDLEGIGENLEMDIKHLTALMHEKAGQIEIESAVDEPDEDDRVDWEPSTRGDDVDDMFRSLREDLED